MYKIPVIYRSDETKYARERSSYFAKLISFLIESYIIKYSDAILCPGQASRQYHIERGAGVEKVFVSPYTTAYDFFISFKSNAFRLRRNEVKSELGISQEKVILFVGEISERKGIMFLLEAFKKLTCENNNVALVIVGSGPLAESLKKQCHQNGLRVYFPGFVNGECKIKYYSIADVFVLPSLVELWGIVINEAMLCGVPVVVTKVAGAAEMVIDGWNGFLVDESDSLQLYAAIKKILSNDEAARMMGMRALKRAMEYNMERRVEGFISAIKYAVKQI